MSDIFREVDEELRQDQMKALAQRYGGLVIAAALAVVIGVAGYVGWKNWREGQRRQATAELDAALNAGPDAVKTLSGFAAAHDGDIAAMARLSAAAALTRDGRVAEAAQVYDAVATDMAVSASYRDLATLLSVSRQLDGGDPAALSTRLTPLQGPAHPWRFYARELAGLLAARAGDRAGAQKLFQQLADDALAPAGVRARAADLAAHYGRTG